MSNHIPSKMKDSLFLFFSCLTCLIFLTGCPYDSQVSLKQAIDLETDERIIGSWHSTLVEDDENKIEVDIEIFSFNQKEYLIEYKVLETDKPVRMTRLRGFISDISGHNIININSLDKPHKFTFYKYRCENDSLFVSFASDQFIKNHFKNTNELMRFFEDNIENKELFEKDLIFTKK